MSEQSHITCSGECGAEGEAIENLCASLAEHVLEESQVEEELGTRCECPPGCVGLPCCH